MTQEKQKFRKEVISCLGRGMVLVGICLLLTGILPDSRPDTLRQELQKMGVNTQGMEFVQVQGGKGFGEVVYHASKPVTYDGITVQDWILSLNRLLPTSPIVQAQVKPVATPFGA